MTRKQARTILIKLRFASESKQPMTKISEILGMDPEWYDTAQDWEDALMVRISDISRIAYNND